jgi:hypothetical protein
MVDVVDAENGYNSPMLDSPTKEKRWQFSLCTLVIIGPICVLDAVALFGVLGGPAFVSAGIATAGFLGLFLASLSNTVYVLKQRKKEKCDDLMPNRLGSQLQEMSGIQSVPAKNCDRRLREARERANSAAS